MQSGYREFEYEYLTEMLYNSARDIKTKLEDAKGSRFKRFFTAMEYKRLCKEVYKIVEVNPYVNSGCINEDHFPHRKRPIELSMITL